MVADRQDQRTVVIEMLPPFLVLASQEIWPSLEDEMDIYEKQGSEYGGYRDGLKLNTPHLRIQELSTSSSYCTSRRKTGVLETRSFVRSAYPNLQSIRPVKSPERGPS